MEGMNLLFVLSLLCKAACVWFALVAVAGLVCRARQGFRPRYSPAAPRTRFAVLAAGRNEEAVISGFVRSILAQDYPRELFDVYVLPNNCTDDTAGTARAAGGYPGQLPVFPDPAYRGGGHPAGCDRHSTGAGPGAAAPVGTAGSGSTGLAGLRTGSAGSAAVFAPGGTAGPWQCAGFWAVHGLLGPAGCTGCSVPASPLGTGGSHRPSDGAARALAAP